MLAMERSPVKDTEIRLLLQAALTDCTQDRMILLHSIDASYRYAGMEHYRTEDL